VLVGSRTTFVGSLVVSEVGTTDETSGRLSLDALATATPPTTSTPARATAEPVMTDRVEKRDMMCLSGCETFADEFFVKINRGWAV